jgi:endonuclease/exonuclease/phosphatase family metal-dependent hydrolase
MTFNLRYDKPDSGNQAWAVRRRAVLTLIQQHQPDILCTQEGKPRQLLDLHRALPDYQSIGEDRTGTGHGEHCAIFYRLSDFLVPAAGDFFLSDTPTIPGSITWDHRVPRMATWAVLRERDSSRDWFVVNTHLDHEQTIAREKSMDLICSEVSRLTQARCPNGFILLTGDFNAEPSEKCRQTPTAPPPYGLRLRDSVGNELSREDQYTFHDFNSVAFLAIDTIYYDRRLTLDDVFIDHSIVDDIFPSDHFPVIGEFSNR